MQTPSLKPADIAKQLDNAKYLHKFGRLAEAERIYREILAVDRNNPEAMSLLAAATYQLGNIGGAKKLWQQCLDANPPAWFYLRNLHNYVQALMKEGKKTEAARLAGRKMPQWPAVRVPDPGEREMLLSLARMLLDLGRAAAVIRLLENVSASLPNDSVLLHELAKAYKMQGDLQAAWQTLRALDATLQGKVHYTLLTDLFLCAQSLGKDEEVHTLVNRVAAATPVFISPRQPHHRHNILILSGLPKLSHAIQSDKQLHFTGNYPAQLADLLAGEFQFSSVFSSNPAAREVARGMIKPDLVINNNANAEFFLSNGDVEAEAAFADSYGVSVINHPRNAVQTGRDQTIRFIADLPDIVVPRTERFSRAGKTGEAVVSKIEARHDYPFIFRRLIDQQGAGMIRVVNRTALAKALAAHEGDEFFITPFVDSRGPTGFYRKIRAAIVDREIFIVRVDHDTNWNVHGRKSDERVAFYQGNRHLLEAEDRTCANPESELGQGVMRSLEGIRDRIPLEIFGVDFDVDKEGRLVFYEANATMNLLSTAPPVVDHPRHAQERLLDAIRRYLNGLMK